MQMLNLLKRSAIVMLATALAVIQANGDIVHVASKGETIYGIANMYHISPDAILQANPQLRTGVKKGMSIVIPNGKSQSTPDVAAPSQTTSASASAKSEPTPKDAATHAASVPSDTHTVSLTYLSSAGDNFEIISRKTGVDPSELMELNPFLDPNNVPSGVLVRLSADAPLFDESDPILKSASPNEVPDPVNADLPSQNYELVGDTIYEVQREQDVQPINHDNILILLPFMSESEEQPKKAQLYTDFYRGFLLAAEDKATTGHKDIDVIVADTNNDFNTLQQEFSSLISHDVAVIIAPEDNAQIRMLADSAAARSVYLLNMFNFSDDTYLSNPWVIQGNINQTLMYDKAIEAVMSEYPGFVPVILAADNSREEKAAFTDALKNKYRSRGLEVKEISFEDALEEKDLASLDSDTRYVFIPRSGSQMVFNRIAPAVLDLKEQDGGSEQYKLFGYPDWTAYRGESLELLQRLGAQVYSRFACDEKKLDNQQLQESFINWYGVPMLEAVPSQAILGYDVANYLIQALRSGDFDSYLSNSMPYRGVQSTFKFGKSNPEGGYVNEALYLIEFMPGDLYNVKAL